VERPRTAAQIRAAEVNARRGERQPREERDEPAEVTQWVREEWIDEGSVQGAVRSAAERAAARAGADGPSSRRREPAVSPEVEGELAALLPASRTARYQERLAAAADALDRGRFGDARRMVQPVLRDVPDMAFGHELAGLASYRLGHYRKAAAELEEARRLDGSIRHHAVLADCYRAMRRYHEVETLWAELREASPDPALMAEGRIVAAGAMARALRASDVPVAGNVGALGQVHQSRKMMTLRSPIRTVSGHESWRATSAKRPASNASPSTASVRGGV